MSTPEAAVRSPMRSSARDRGVDAVRGVAIVSMFVAHAAPGGPLISQLGTLADFLTAALFATLVGVGSGMSRGPLRLRAALVRGTVLIVVGLFLEQAGAQVVVILVYLGVLTWVVALLRPLPSWALGIAAIWLAVVSPMLRVSWFDNYLTLLSTGHQLAARVVEIVFVGSSYRLTTLTVWALLGMLAARHLLGRTREPRLLAVLGVSALAAAVAIYLASGGTAEHTALAPYSGTVPEIAFDALLSVSVLLLGVLVSDRVGFAAAWLASLGRMSLTVYTAQVLGWRS